MSAPNITRWIGIGLLGLPLYGVLTFWSSLDPQPDPNVHYEAWSRFVTTDHYVLTHLFGSILGMILAIFGTFALGAYLANGRVGRLGLVAMVVTVLGSALFLPGMGVSAFAAPEEGQAYLAGIEEFSKLPNTFVDTAFAATNLLMVLTMFEDDKSIFAAMRAGAHGYVLKGADGAETLRAIHAVANGEAIFSPTITRRLTGYFATPGETPKRPRSRLSRT